MADLENKLRNALKTFGSNSDKKTDAENKEIKDTNLNDPLSNPETLTSDEKHKNNRDENDNDEVEFLGEVDNVIEDLQIKLIETEKDRTQLQDLVTNLTKVNSDHQAKEKKLQDLVTNLTKVNSEHQVKEKKRQNYNNNMTTLLENLQRKYDELETGINNDSHQLKLANRTISQLEGSIEQYKRKENERNMKTFRSIEHLENLVDKLTQQVDEHQRKQRRLLSQNHQLTDQAYNGTVYSILFYGLATVNIGSYLWGYLF